MLFRQTGQLRETQRWVEHSYEVKLEVESLERSLREAESIQRAMLLSGGDAPADMLERFEELLGELSGHVKKLSVLVADNEEQAVLVREAAELTRARIGILADNARDFPSLGPKERSERILKGVAVANTLEQRLGAIRDLEQVLLEGRSEASGVQAKRLLAMATGGSCLALLVMLLALVQERRNRALRHRYQERLAEARDAALDSVQATSVFVASVSHEIRTPMNGVLGAADLLRRDVRLDRHQRELVETIRHSGESLLELVNDILDLSKLQAGKMEFVQEDFELAEVLDETLEVLADGAGRKGLELASRVDPLLPRRFRGDPRRLRQVLLNLVGNAVKFTDEGGVLVEVMSRGDKEGGGAVVLRFSVTDTGPGISAEERQRLFQPFSQVNSSLNRRHAGTGLGLAISQEIVQRLGGVMGVESEPGSGSVFWFTASFQDATVPEDRCERLCNGGTLLLLEDRELTAGSIRQHVLAWGMRVVVVKSQDELAGLVWPDDCAAVLIGKIGDMSWREVVGILSRVPESGVVPRFLLSRAHEHPEAEDLVRSGIRSCLRYPFRPSDFYNLLADDRSGPVLPPGGEAPLPRARVLLVEDNPINQRVFCRQLEALGLEFLVRGDGQEGVDARRGEAVDLILMDCQLPTVDGFEATRRIRAWEERTGSGRIPIIAVTAHVMAGDAEACYQAGMDDYLAKPFDLAKLRRKLSSWLGGQGDSADVRAPVVRMSPQVVDGEQLGECLTGDAEMDKDLIAASMEEARVRRDEMSAALEAADDGRWRASAHRGAGSCATLGFTGLAAAFRAAEHDSGDVETRRESLVMIDGFLARTDAALAALGLADQGPDLV